MKKISIRAMDAETRFASLLAILCPIGAISWVIEHGEMAAWFYALVGSGIPALYAAFIAGRASSSVQAELGTVDSQERSIWQMDKAKAFNYLAGWVAVAWFWGSLRDEAVWEMTRPLTTLLDNTYYALVGIKYSLSSLVEPYAIWKRFLYSTISLLAIFWIVNLSILFSAHRGGGGLLQPSQAGSPNTVPKTRRCKFFAALWQLVLFAGFGILLPYLIFKYQWFWPVIEIGTREGRTVVDQDPYYSIAWILGGLIFAMGLMTIHSVISRAGRALATASLDK